MEATEYQEEIKQFTKYKSPLYPFLALSSEAAEVSEVIEKRHLRAGEPLSSVLAEHGEAIALELGDVMYMVANIGAAVGYRLEDIMALNIDKLERRVEEGTLLACEKRVE